MAEEETLSFAASLTPQKIELRARFHTFGDDALPEALTDANHGADDGAITSIRGDLLHEGTVHLHGVERKAPQVTEAGIAGAKVVHGKLHAHAFQPAKSGDSGF